MIKKIKHGKIKNPRILAIRESRYRNSRNCSTFPGISLFDHFFAVCAADEIIDAGVVIICQPDKHFDRNITGSRFIMGIRTLTDMKILSERDLRLYVNPEYAEISLCSPLLSIESIKQNEMHPCKREQNGLY